MNFVTRFASQNPITSSVVILTGHVLSLLRVRARTRTCAGARPQYIYIYIYTVTYENNGEHEEKV